MNSKYRRTIYKTALKRFKEPRRFIQVLLGARQVGKTTLVQQALVELLEPAHYVVADEPVLKDRAWIEQQWNYARLKLKSEGAASCLLVLDEAQKIIGWSETVKRLWDEDTANDLPLKVILLGSSPLLVQRGLTESLAGRFEVLHVPHWSYSEIQEAFGWDWQRYVFYGGYPGAAPLIEEEGRWRSYILSSLIETTMSRDIFLISRVDKPALLRRLFQLVCEYSGQVVSYQKMLGQLQEKGNTTTLAHYLDLFAGAGLATGLAKYSGSRIRQRASSPKLQVLNTALMSASSAIFFEEARKNTELWGRLVESAAGAHLVNEAQAAGAEVFYWLDRNREVDFVLKHGNALAAIEVKSGRRKTALPGMEAFCEAHEVKRKFLVGEGGIPVEEFLKTPALQFLD